MECSGTRSGTKRVWRTGGGTRGSGAKVRLEGVLSKYTNVIQGWQNRYFVVDEELNQLQYFMNESGRSQKPRGVLSLIGASVTVSDEVPHMFIISSSNGEFFKLRALDEKQQQIWISHLQSCVKSRKDMDDHQLSHNLDTQVSSRRSFSLLPSSSSSSSSSPRQQRHPPDLPHLTHLTHTPKSPASAQRSKHTPPEALLEVREVLIRAESEQESLARCIDSLPRHGFLSCLDPDLLLIKATSAATMCCISQCVTMLQVHTHPPDSSHSQAPPPAESSRDTMRMSDALSRH